MTMTFCEYHYDYDKSHNFFIKSYSILFCTFIALNLCTEADSKAQHQMRYQSSLVHGHSYDKSYNFTTKIRLWHFVNGFPDGLYLIWESTQNHGLEYIPSELVHIHLLHIPLQIKIACLIFFFERTIQRNWPTGLTSLWLHTEYWCCHSWSFSSVWLLLSWHFSSWPTVKKVYRYNSAWNYGNKWNISHL